MAKIALFTTGEGHYSIHQAIQQALAPDHHTFECKQPLALQQGYRLLYRFVPAAHTITYKISHIKRYQAILSRIFEKKYSHVVNEFILQHKPDLLINTYFGFNPSLDVISELTGIPYLNIVTDPRTFHPVTVSPQATLNLTYDQVAAQNFDQLFPKLHTRPIGWFVRNQFEQTYNQQQVRDKLNLDPNMLTFLITSGSEGTNMILKVLPVLFTTSQPIQVIVACGSNQTLHTGVEAVRTLLARTSPRSKLISLNFVTNMEEYIQAADLVIGKAGPNTIFEATATLTPYFAITHVGGQEDGNLDIIREKNLGYVEENPLKATRKLLDIISQPDQLSAFRDSLRQEAEYNHLAKDRLRHISESLIASRKK